MTKLAVLTAIVSLSVSSVFGMPGKGTHKNAPVESSSISITHTAFSGGFVVSNSTTSRAYVTIFDELENVVYHEFMPVSSLIPRTYNLSQLPEGRYRIKITVGNRNYTDYVTVGDK